MPDHATPLGSLSPVRVMLVDLDPIFRMGLKTCLEVSPEFEVVTDFGRASEILQQLDQLRANRTDAGPNLCPVDLLVWSVDVRHAGHPGAVGLPQLMRSQYPALPICVLLAQNDSWLLQELWQSSVEGCWLKDANQVALLAAMRQIASGQRVWDARLLSQLTPQEQVPDMIPKTSSPLGGLVLQARQTLGDRGLRELEQGLAELDQLLAGPGLGVWERFVLEGRFREMQVAKTLVQAVILPGGNERRQPDPRPWPNQREVERRIPGMDSVTLSAEPLQNESNSAALVTANQMGTGVAETASAVALDTEVVTENQFQTYKGVLIDAVIAKLSEGLRNLTAEPLELDILTPTKRQELCFIIMRQLEETLDDLRFSQVTPVQLTQQRSQILIELWQRSTADFFGKYVMLPTVDSAQVQLVPKLLESQAIVASTILAKIPLVDAWMAHLIFQTPLQVNNQAATIGSPEAMRQAQALLENLIVRVANAVIAPLLNQFGSVELVKQTFYDRRWISTREIERFRNALSWKYRMNQFFGEPKQIFESQIPVLVLTDMGIRCQELYTPRDEELQRLNGIPLFVTLALEARDAIAPPLRASFTWVGRGVVYLLTQVVGRGIGLIGRGIVQGLGTAWQETRDSRQQAVRRDSDSVNPR